MNFRYPIFLDLTGKRCLVVGEGYEISAKVQALVDAAAEVIYINSVAAPEIAQLASAGFVTWLTRDFKETDLNGCFLAIASLPDNARVFRLCEERNILCNSVDDPKHCRFSFGSVHRRGELAIAISTNGRAPALAVRLKQRFQREIGPEFEKMLAVLKGVRSEIGRRVPAFGARKKLWYQIVDSEMLELFRKGRDEDARMLLKKLIDEAVNNTSDSDTSGSAGNR